MTVRRQGRQERRLVTGTLMCGVICAMLAVFSTTAWAAPVELLGAGDATFVVTGQEADTGTFTVPAGYNRTIVIAVHARTDSGTVANDVTVEWANLDGDSGLPFTKSREAIRTNASMYQSTTLLYRHIDNTVSGGHTVRVRMVNALADNKVVQVYVFGNVDPNFSPVAGDANGSNRTGIGSQALVALGADVDYLVVDAATHNSAANVTGRAPVKTWYLEDNSTPLFKSLTGWHVTTALSTLNYSYTMGTTSADWSIVTTRFLAAYNITATEGANGSIAPSGDVPVTSGGSQSFDIAADMNYVIAQLLVDGSAVVDAAGLETYTYDFTNVTTNHTIEVTFSGRPVITVDPATVDFECTTSGYTDVMAMSGVSALDPEDDDITSNVAMSGVTFPLITPGVYTILYDVADSENTPASQQQRVVTIADTLAPVIAMNGEDSVQLECGLDSYVELDATAQDQCEGALDPVLGGDTVNAALVGTYLVTYDVTDGAGLSADQAVRTVDVVDTTGPVITLLSADPVVLDGGASYAEAGATAWDACLGDIAPESIVIDNVAVNTGVIGTYQVSYTAVDGYGNANTEYLSVVVQRETCVLIVNTPVTVVSALPAEEVTLAVELDPASCAVGTVTYEWKKQSGEGEDFVVIPGAPNSPTYVIASAVEGDTGVYRCDVSDSMYTVSSEDIMLTVGTGLPVAGLAGIALATALAALAGTVALRKREK